MQFHLEKTPSTLLPWSLRSSGGAAGDLAALVGYDPVTLLEIEDVLRELGFRCVVLGTPSDAAGVLAEGRFQLLVAEHAIPSCIGLSPGARPVVVVVTGRPQSIDVADRWRIDAIAAKPVIARDLAGAIHRARRRRTSTRSVA